MKRSSRGHAVTSSVPPGPDRPAREFYSKALTHLVQSKIPFLVGGAFAYAQYMRIDRATKDLDILLRPGDVPRALALFRELGYRTDLLFPHWLGKVRDDGFVIDLIFSSGNGVARVDDLWFEHAVQADVLGRRVGLCPPEELIWSKAFVQERERFDGGDVLHLFRELGAGLDWARLLERFGAHWRVLLSHIVLFGFVYPNRRDRVPPWVETELTKRLVFERPEPASRVCLGTLLSREQYLDDIYRLGYLDARMPPTGHMTEEEIAIWTAAVRSS